MIPPLAEHIGSDSRVRRAPYHDRVDQLIVQLRATDDVLMWGALVDTDHGVAQFAHVVILDQDGRFRRHITGLRGYWGG